ncbi:MAG: site-specific integrase [Saprospiraceae bacterium]
MQPRFYLKSTGKGDEARLVIMFFNYRIGKMQIRFNYSTQVYVPPSRWNRTTQKAKAARDFPQHQQINAALGLIGRTAETIYYKFKGELKIRELTKMVFKEQMDKQLHREFSETDLLGFMKEKIQERKDGTVSRGTWKNDQVALHHLEDFAKIRRKQALYFDEITIVWSKSFQQYLFDQGLQNNYVHKMLSKVKQFMRKAQEEGKTDNTEYQSPSFQVSKTKTSEVYLTIDELRALENLQLQGTTKDIRDIFLVLAFTGVRFSDVGEVRLSNLVPSQRKKLFRISTQKTDQTVTIPAHPLVLEILAQHGGTLPQYTNQFFNREIKLICQKAGINQDISKVKTVQGRKEVKAVKKWERIYSHTGRRSFATNAFLAGMRPEDVIKITGHADTKTLLIYIRADDLRVGMESAKHEFFTEW